MKRFFFLIAGLAVTFGIWKILQQGPSWRQNLAQSPTLTLYSLEPESQHWPHDTAEDAPQIKGSLILSSTLITSAEEKAQLLTAIDKRMNGNAQCEFAPRHALESADKRTRLVACFECGQCSVAGQTIPSPGSPSFSPLAAPIFNAILKKHGVPLSHLGKVKRNEKRRSNFREAFLPL